MHTESKKEGSWLYGETDADCLDHTHERLMNKLTPKRSNLLSNYNFLYRNLYTFYAEEKFIQNTSTQQETQNTAVPS